MLNKSWLCLILRTYAQILCLLKTVIRNDFVSFIVNHTVQRKQNHIFSGSIIKKKALYLIKSVYLFICLVKLLDEKSEFPLIRGIPPDLK